jgi:predicted HTH transcriptional regulator
MRNLYYYTDIYSEGQGKPVLTEGDLFTTEIPIQAAAAGVIQDVSINKLNVPLNVPLDVPLNVPLNEPINETALLVLQMMAKQPEATLEMIAENIGKTLKTVKRAVKNLKDSGYVKRIGPRKTGHWEVNSNGNEIKSGSLP